MTRRQEIKLFLEYDWLYCPDRKALEECTAKYAQLQEMIEQNRKKLKRSKNTFSLVVN